MCRNVQRSTAARQTSWKDIARGPMHLVAAQSASEPLLHTLATAYERVHLSTKKCAGATCRVAMGHPPFPYTQNFFKQLSIGFHTLENVRLRCIPTRRYI